MLTAEVDSLMFYFYVLKCANEVQMFDNAKLNKQVMNI